MHLPLEERIESQAENDIVKYYPRYFQRYLECIVPTLEELGLKGSEGMLGIRISIEVEKHEDGRYWIFHSVNNGTDSDVDEVNAAVERARNKLKQGEN